MPANCRFLLKTGAMSTSYAAKVVSEARDIVFAKITAQLYFNDFYGLICAIR